MTPRWHRLASAAVAIVCMTGVAGAQDPPAAPSPAPGPSRLWLVVGGTSTTLRGDCQDCEQGSDYRQAPGLLVNFGFRVNGRMDAGGEVFWVPSTAKTGERVRSTFVMGAAQFRPWGSHGFFLKAGMGMGFVRNWIFEGAGRQPPFTSKALGLSYGAGWAFNRDRRVGLEILGTQHVAALGDLKTGTTNVENVVGNFWSIGAAVVIR